MQWFMRPAMFAAVVAITGVTVVHSVAEASVTVTAQQTGGDVIFSTGGGTLDLTALSFESSSSTRGFFHPAQRIFTLGGSPGSNLPVDIYDGTNGPSNYGSGGFTTATSGTGDRFGITFAGKLNVPGGFVSGESIAASSATFTAQTFAGLGITPGSYTWSWGSDETFDSVTLNVVPLPAAAWLMLSGLAGLFGYGRMQRQKLA